MKKQRTNQKSQSLIKGLGTSAAVTAALFPSTVPAGAGDLDPTFGNLGRLGPILEGPAWSVQPQDDGAMILGGGRPGYSYYYWGGHYVPPTAFIQRLSGDGTVDTGYAPAEFSDVQVRDVARQPDGQVVAVGRRYLDPQFESWQLAAYRVQEDGSLDTTFGDEGLFTLPAEEHGWQQLATSVVIDPDGRIAIAGSRYDKLIVLRLLPDGSVDGSFADTGLFVGPDNLDRSSDGSGASTSIIPAGGGYRLTVSNAGGCQLIALTADGALDADFGTTGQATVQPPVEPATACHAVAAQANGRLVVVGQTAGHGFATRLLADGQPDAAFAADTAVQALTNATAVAVGDDGAILVGGHRDSDGTVLRLGSNGAPDPTFGDAGRTVIDFESAYPVGGVMHDMHVGADGSVTAVGGAISGQSAVAVRLLGNAGGDAPGVVGFMKAEYEADSEGGDIVMTLRRSGGSSGPVSVAYELGTGGWETASAGVDYDFDAGTLAWEDGDTSVREIRIPVHADDAVEEPESFGVELSGVQGGAGLGSYTAVGAIPADGKPFGQLSLGATTFGGAEGAAAVIEVVRNWYEAGAVSVTVTPRSGTAEAGMDFDAAPLTLTWADGEWGYKSVSIPIINDSDEEPAESFAVELSNAAGGALIAAPALAVVRIGMNDSPRAAATPGSGGGAMGLLSLLLLGGISLLRRVLRLPPGRHAPG